MFGLMLGEVQCGGLIPNQAMLINTIPVLEAQASSEIENSDAINYLSIPVFSNY
jgi:Fic/DOC family N-terminal